MCIRARLTRRIISTLLNATIIELTYISSPRNFEGRCLQTTTKQIEGASVGTVCREFHVSR